MYIPERSSYVDSFTSLLVFLHYVTLSALASTAAALCVRSTQSIVFHPLSLTFSYPRVLETAFHWELPRDVVVLQPNLQPPLPLPPPPPPPAECFFKLQNRSKHQAAQTPSPSFPANFPPNPTSNKYHSPLSQKKSNHETPHCLLLLHEV